MKKNQPAKAPRYIRLPAGGSYCPITGLSRTALDLVSRPQKANDFRAPVKSHIFLQPGSTKGVRLIDLASLLDYINGLPTISQQQKEKTA